MLLYPLIPVPNPSDEVCELLNLMVLLLRITILILSPCEKLLCMWGEEGVTPGGPSVLHGTERDTRDGRNVCVKGQSLSIPLL